ncbi:MAG: phosphoserine phosphatase SerB [Alphaproteobacteria bacterium]|jgi:phosphoserine phosphatase|nr:phosphoserine phosphatase SerB [Alphaproteobacteria bacterium]MBT5860258.1 phosphoserine phosphatase SerB [Alphaproteobacteria bacterium]
MEYVLTLIGQPGANAVSDKFVARAGVALDKAGARVEDTTWLAPETAADISFHDVDWTRGYESVVAELSGQPIDIAVQRPADRKKRLLVADMDSTIIAQECLDELADLAGVGAKVAELTARAMAGELDFADALRERVEMLAGVSAALLQETFDERVTLNPGARTLVKTMTSNGAVTALVSGGFQFFTSRVAEAAGFGSFGGNLFEIEGDKLTGRITGHIVGAEAKQTTLEALMAEHSIPAESTLAVGDGANDIPMLKAAGLGVAVRPKPVVRDAADVTLDHGDLTALLYVQGYRLDEFVD